MVFRFELNDPVPHHSTISWNRRTRFKDTTIFHDIFDEIVLQAINHDMVGGRVLFNDSTHLKANANKHKYTRKTIEQDTQSYINELEEAVALDSSYLTTAICKGLSDCRIFGVIIHRRFHPSSLR